MSVELMIEILKIIGYILLGGLSLYLKTKENLKEKACCVITEAETKYQDMTNAGEAKFEYAIDKLYAQIPAVFKPFMTRTMIGTIVQTVFESVESYARLRLDKLADTTQSRALQ